MVFRRARKINPRNKEKNEVEMPLLEYIVGVKKVFAFKTPDKAVFLPERGFLMSKHPYSIKGLPDVIAMLPGGRIVFFECKSAHGVQSEHQYYFQRQCERLGYEYYLIRRFDVAQIDAICEKAPDNSGAS